MAQLPNLTTCEPLSTHIRTSVESPNQLNSSPISRTLQSSPSNQIETSGTVLSPGAQSCSGSYQNPTVVPTSGSITTYQSGTIPATYHSLPRRAASQHLQTMGEKGAVGPTSVGPTYSTIVRTKPVTAISGRGSDGCNRESCV